MDDIIEALENTCVVRKDRGRLGYPAPATPDKYDVISWRNRLLRFFESIDGDITVTEIIEALEDYA